MYQKRFRKFKCKVTIGRPYQIKLLSDEEYRRVCDRFDSGHHYTITVTSLDELEAVRRYSKDNGIDMHYYKANMRYEYVDEITYEQATFLYRL